MTTDVSKSNPFFDGNSPVEYIYEDEQCVVFEAKDKQAPVHLLIVPRKAIPRLYAATADDEKLLAPVISITSGPPRLRPWYIHSLYHSGITYLSNDKRIFEIGPVVPVDIAFKQTFQLYNISIEVLAPILSTKINHIKKSGHILLVAKKMVLQMGLDKTGYHLMVDENHITNRLKSVHVFGRALHHMIWPVGPGCRL